MKIIKDLLKISNNQREVQLILKHNYLYFNGLLGISYLNVMDLNLIKNLEYILYNNQIYLNTNLIKNLLIKQIKTVTTGWYLQLLMIGLGFRVKINNMGFLLFNLGYSHAFAVKIPKSINILINKDKLLLFSLDLILLGKFMNILINLRKMDPYKGKGIRLLSNVVKLKVGKKKQKT